MADLVCEQCGKTFEGTRARFCGSGCRTRRARGAKPAGPGRPKRRADYCLRDRVRAELKEAGRESSALGLIALDLASQLGQQDLPPASRGVFIRELRVTLEAALAGGAKETRVDELKGRRDAKRTAARRRASG